MKRQKLMKQIVIAIVLGILVGWGCHQYSGSIEQAKELASYMNIITDVFLRLIKMIIAPLVFATIVSGIVSMGGSSSVGSITLKAMLWFISAALVSLLIGMFMVNFFQPGAGLNLSVPTTSVSTGLNTSGFSLKTFISHIFPRSFAEAMANNEILQILIFSIFFGSGLSFICRDGKSPVAIFIEDLARIMFRITDYVMSFAPVAVFAAISSAITVEGLGLLYDYGKLIGLFYVGLAILWGILFIVGYAFLGKSVFGLGKLIREPVALAFATASSESAYPKTMDALDKFGVPKKITSFVLPLGYSFNLDGSMLYQSFAILFIAQAYNIDLSLTEQVLILLTLMVTSKGMAGVARASVVVVAATLPMFNLPEAGILLILGIDQFLDMGRTATNVVGNSISTAVISRLESKKKAAQADKYAATSEQAKSS
ncbi:dicarboxylate/amino acid:cation symporter [Erwinia psidii]|uniref:Dicarboxylate/amino acid:cation symporter n=1 Tax=Erwinia psidii TaxID=69224 RepID=A0A3N6UMG0_9GAMM|nr:dicarboxylate/amino acid:cation symporter [Erwinia psidii]MCX8958130.1 dicarboxylate/amino acid:cation symporter [Erwinia psidii]MCX8962530.1 dicarboxylate/amino acid:cation symporter [Erwinia psidii]MCX8966337.1 dicarboxylate/amino acid:cation symporter [Erwinia psidii]RQM37109.1 dicarboxylate/amino acid:cation symporter [Erwinia psidii]